MSDVFEGTYYWGQEDDFWLPDADIDPALLSQSSAPDTLDPAVLTNVEPSLDFNIQPPIVQGTPPVVDTDHNLSPGSLGNDPAPLVPYVFFFRTC